MTAIYKREMRSYFTTPIGYVFLTVFLFFSEGLFCYTTLFSRTSNVKNYFTAMLFLLVILLPLLTMKLFSEEKKQRTEQLLLTSPVSLFSMVFGKFLAAYTVFAGAMIISSLSFLILYAYTEIQTALIIGNVFAMLLVGMAFISVGVFVSSITESQLAAAVGTVAVLAVMLVISFLNSFINTYFIRFILSSLSVFSRYGNFTEGVFDVSALVYYLSVSAVFLFLSICVYDKRRWQ